MAHVQQGKKKGQLTKNLEEMTRFLLGPDMSLNSSSCKFDVPVQQKQIYDCIASNC